MKNYLTHLKINSTKTIELSPGNFIAEPLEWREQAALIAQTRAPDVLKLYPHMNRLYCVPNGIPLVPALRMKMQRMGLTPGIPDLHWPVSRGPYNSLYIELKRLVSGSLSDAEKEWVEFLRSEGHAVHLAHGRWEAYATLLWYNSIPTGETYVPPGGEPLRKGREIMIGLPMNLDFSWSVTLDEYGNACPLLGKS